MKRLKYIVLSLLAVVFAACQDDMSVNRPTGGIDADGNVHLCFNTEIPDMEQVQTRAVDPDGYGVNSLWLFCFDQYRHYIGRVQAEVSQTASSEESISGSFTATIPGATRHLHFIANLNVNDFEDAPNLGRLDTEVIPQFTTTSGLLCYWGYKTFASVEELIGFATGAGSEVSMFRNQARIRYLRSDGGTNLSIKGMAIMNQYSRGTVAPFNRKVDGGDPFAFTNASDIKEPTLCADEDVLVAVDPSDVSQFGGGSVGRFVFEHANKADNPMYLIFRINTSGGSQDDGNWHDGDRYYKIALVDASGNQLPLLRNYDYVINFKGIPANGGYATFEEAVDGAAANNVWVSIDQTIPAITDGKSSLAIVGETTRIITKASLSTGGTYKFDYQWYDGTGAGIVPEVTWVQNSGIAKADIGNYFQSGKSLEDPGTGTITIIPTNIGNPQYGILQIKAGKFVRTVKLISLSNFSFTPVWTSSGLPMRSGEPVAIAFTIPDNFPQELFPLDVKIACNLFDDDGSNVNMAGEQTYLDVVVEECKFTVMEDGKENTYERDWPHKYVYTVDRPGLHRVNFETLIDNYTPNQDEDPRIEFFLEAEAFTTVRSLIYMNEDNKNYRIALGTVGTGNNLEWAKENSASVVVPPAAGQVFDLHFKFYDGQTSPMNPIAEEVLRIYMDITKMKPVITGQDLSAEPFFDPDKGYYYTYTVPEQLRDNYETEGVKIPVRTQTSDCNTYLRVSSQLNENGTFPNGKRVYRSAILTISNAETYNFKVKLNDVENLKMPYGPGQTVNMQVSFPPEVLTYRQEGFTGFIATNTLEPAAEESRLTPVEGGYTFAATASEMTFQFVTRDVACEEKIMVSERGNQVAFYPKTVTIGNTRLTGTVELLREVFNQTNPFMSLEREDGTRIGVLNVIAEQGENTGTFTLELRTEYKLNMDERVFVRYSPMTPGDERVFTAFTTIRSIQDYPDNVITLIQR